MIKNKIDGLYYDIDTDFLKPDCLHVHTITSLNKIGDRTFGVNFCRECWKLITSNEIKKPGDGMQVGIG